MGQEFFIKNSTLESKVRELLPSQGGLGAGFDLTASTQIIPIVDLTESAEGSNVRADLQSALSFNDITSFDVTNTTTTIINNTGYYRVIGVCSSVSDSGSTVNATFELNDGSSDKVLQKYKNVVNSNTTGIIVPFDFIVFLPAGHSLKAQSSATKIDLIGCTKQIATIDGILTTPS